MVAGVGIGAGAGIVVGDLLLAILVRAVYANKTVSCASYAYCPSATGLVTSTPQFLGVTSVTSSASLGWSRLVHLVG